MLAASLRHRRACSRTRRLSHGHLSHGIPVAEQAAFLSNRAIFNHLQFMRKEEIFKVPQEAS